MAHDAAWETRRQFNEAAMAEYGFGYEDEVPEPVRQMLQNSEAALSEVRIGGKPTSDPIRNDEEA